MLIGEIVAAAVVVAALVVVLLSRRAAHDDLHSVQGYHRSIHTLESINAHPSAPDGGAESTLAMKQAYPESAIRVARTSSVRVTDAPSGSLQPVPPLPVSHPDVPVTFDDTDPSAPPMPSHESPVSRDKAMVSINHRPRRLAAPAMAVAAVIVLVVVLLLTGSHTVVPPRHHGGGSTGRSNGTFPSPSKGNQTGNTTTTLAPPSSSSISVPQSSSSSLATYDVSGGNYSLSFEATSGPCWVDVTNSTTRATLYAGTLQPGQTQSLNADAPVTVIIGAPTVLAVAVNGSSVALPSGFDTPFTMRFVATS
jgi:Domain of unknown function (DUF4115)